MDYRNRCTFQPTGTDPFVTQIMRPQAYPTKWNVSHNLLNNLMFILVILTKSTTNIFVIEWGIRSLGYKNNMEL